jgi:hypothetical protein
LKRHLWFSEGTGSDVKCLACTAVPSFDIDQRLTRDGVGCAVSGSEYAMSVRLLLRNRWRRQGRTRFRAFASGVFA